MAHPSAPLNEPPPLDLETPWYDDILKHCLTVSNHISPFQRGIRQVQLQEDEISYPPCGYSCRFPLANNIHKVLLLIIIILFLLSRSKKKQACTKYGTNSPYTTSLIQRLPQTERLIPFDWDMVARTHLLSSEFLQFKTLWQDETNQQAH